MLFADLFAGIGGMRFAFESTGASCVLTSEIDAWARHTYKLQNWRSNDERHMYVDDVNNLAMMKPKQIPDFDILLAGFPCQPYSIAGLRQGLDDEKGRGAVFLSMLEVLRKKLPDAFMLENVKGMLSHDQGRTIRYMVEQLQNLGGGKQQYEILGPVVLNSMTHGGVPQNRERVFLVGFRTGLDLSPFSWPDEIPMSSSLRGLLDVRNVAERYFYSREKYSCFDEIERGVKSRDTAYQWRRVYVRENKSGVCPALTANMGSGGHNVPLVIHDDGRIRKLTPRECMKLQGFDQYKFTMPSDVADAHLYHQFGNSVTVPLIERLARSMVKVLRP